MSGLKYFLLLSIIKALCCSPQLHLNHYYSPSILQMMKYFPGVSKGWVVFHICKCTWSQDEKKQILHFLLIHLLLTLVLFHKTSEYSLTRDLQLMNWETERSWFDSVIMWKWQKHRTMTGEQINHGHDCQQQTRYWHNHKVLLSPCFVCTDTSHSQQTLTTAAFHLCKLYDFLCWNHTNAIKKAI